MKKSSLPSLRKPTKEILLRLKPKEAHRWLATIQIASFHFRPLVPIALKLKKAIENTHAKSVTI